MRDALAFVCKIYRMLYVKLSQATFDMAASAQLALSSFLWYSLFLRVSSCVQINVSSILYLMSFCKRVLGCGIHDMSPPAVWVFHSCLSQGESTATCTSHDVMTKIESTVSIHLHTVYCRHYRTKA